MKETNNYSRFSSQTLKVLKSILLPHEFIFVFNLSTAVGYRHFNTCYDAQRLLLMIGDWTVRDITTLQVSPPNETQHTKHC